MSESKLKLNLNAKAWIPKSKMMQQSQQSQPPSQPPSQPSQPHTSLSLSAKAYVPKFRKQNMGQTASEQPRAKRWRLKMTKPYIKSTAMRNSVLMSISPFSRKTALR